MAALTGTISTAGKNGELGQQYQAVGTYALGGALAAADTITWTGLLPKGKFKVVSGYMTAPELDTNASPTGTIKIGDGTDDDAYLTESNIGLPAQAPANGYPLTLPFNGASMGTTVSALPNVVATVVGVMATSATSGTIRVVFNLEGV
jgi:hypothetical protein